MQRGYMKRDFLVAFCLMLLAAILSFAANAMLAGAAFLAGALACVHYGFKAHGVGSGSTLAGFSGNQSEDFYEDFKDNLLAQGDLNGYATGVPSSNLFDD